MTGEDEAAFTELAARISREAGLPIHAYKDKCLRRRIAVRMRACGVHSYSEYQTFLDRSPSEYQRLRDAITINVTRFYRNAETWDLIRETVIREICSQERPEVRAWSAGCSSGEEPYTLAMLIADCLDSQGRGDRLRLVTIDATDVDRESLARAEDARYSAEVLSELPHSLLDRYLEKEGEACRVTERVRRRVVVRSSDLSTDPPPRRNYHLIVCRNVVIYFGREAQERIFSVFADALAPGGFLVLGKVETLLGPARERLTLLDPRERVYRRAA
jgi:chemotaxis methyl-accepting protein methylase